MKNLKNYLKTRVEKFIRLGEVYTNAYSMKTAVYYIRSRFAMFVAMLMLGVVVSACGGNDDDDASNNTSSAEDGIYSMKFSTAYDGENYDLFTLYIGGEVGDATYLGALKGKDGSENEVYVLPYELKDLSKLDAAQQDKIYAMQEALNEVLGE